MSDEKPSDTPTADATEEFLRGRRQGMSMEQFLDQEGQPSYGNFCDNIKKDPYNSANVLFHVLKFMGYKISFQEGATNIHGQDIPGCIKAMTDSRETSKKIYDIIPKTKDYAVHWILEEVSSGDPYRIEFLLEGNQEAFYKSHPSVKFRLAAANSGMQVALERCFIQAYDEHQQRDAKLENMGHTSIVAATSLGLG